MQPERPSIWSHDSNETASGKPGTLHTAHDFALEHEQKAAWQHQVITLQKLLRSSPAGHIFFEFSIPRMGKRADVVVLIGSTVFVIEYKVGSSEATKQDLRQTHDYALDLKNFHEASHDLPIIPVLIPTGLSGTELPKLEWATDDVASPIAIPEEAIPELLAKECRTKLAGSIDAIEWADSRYKPTPTIVEAAQSLYSSHTVTDITRSDAGAKNLNQTSEFIERVIDNAKANSEKAICFVTGVPGAGKTLVGLNISVQRGEKSKQEHAVFLSGNGPLVNVLREALARDKSSRENITKTDAKREVNSFIQNIHHFRDDALRTPNAPVEHVVIFDEAQRAWDKPQTSRFMTQKRGQAGGLLPEKWPVL
jgi:schlafen family protein